MTTITLRFNEQTAEGKSLLEYLKTQPVEIIKPTTRRAIKTSDEKSYDPAFVKKIKDSQSQFKEGKGTKIKTEDLWK